MDILFTLAVGFLSIVWGDTPTQLEQIKQQNELLVAIRNSPLTYYETSDGYAGLEYDLASAFADQLGVQLRIKSSDDSTDILGLVANNQVHFAAAGLLMNDWRKHNGMRFGPAYYQVTTQIVGIKGRQPRWRKIRDISLSNACVMAIEGTLHAHALAHAGNEYPTLYWHVTKQWDAIELLENLADYQLDLVAVGSHELRYVQHYHPELYPLFDLSTERSMAWIFERFTIDDSLYIAAIQFFNEMRENGELERLLDRYYGHMKEFDYVNMRAYHRHIESRLPKYIETFKTEAERYQFDWRFLAAIGYQESRWNPAAVSPTGVRGLMMLTEATAQRMGVKNRRDATQSIQGGARYLAWLRSKIPATIPEPDRSWMMLAAYNMGPGHLFDARKLAAKEGDNPDSWLDVEKYIEKLSKRRWYSRTKHGYARGFEAISFVQRIRGYYDVLLKLENDTEETNNADDNIDNNAENGLFLPDDINPKRILEMLELNV
jgi:membrane-bound lytic murein transglycosylase F